MATIKQDIDLSVLSDEARKELIDFYQFLINKYGKIRLGKEKRFQNLVEKPFRMKNIVIPTREQLHER